MTLKLCGYTELNLVAKMAPLRAENPAPTAKALSLWKRGLMANGLGHVLVLAHGHPGAPETRIRMRQAMKATSRQPARIR